MSRRPHPIAPHFLSQIFMVYVPVAVFSREPRHSNSELFMSPHEEIFDLELSPNVRLRITAAEEMRLDTNDEIFTDELHLKYVNMQKEAERQLQVSIKGIGYADIGLCLLLFGKNVKIPGTDFGLQDIPAAIEVLTVVASFYFLVLAQTFANNQCYIAIIEQFSNRKTLRLGIDPDFVTFGNVFSQLYLKAFRYEMNFFGRDFFRPKKRYQTFYGMVIFLLASSWISIIIMHLIVVGFGVWKSIGESWVWWPFAAAIILLHLTGVLMNMFIDFSFDTPMRSAVHEDRRAKAAQQAL